MPSGNEKGKSPVEIIVILRCLGQMFVFINKCPVVCLILDNKHRREHYVAGESESRTNVWNILQSLPQSRVHHTKATRRKTDEKTLVQDPAYEQDDKEQGNQDISSLISSRTVTADAESVTPPTDGRYSILDLAETEDGEEKIPRGKVNEGNICTLTVPAVDDTVSKHLATTSDKEFKLSLMYDCVSESQNNTLHPVSKITSVTHSNQSDDSVKSFIDNRMVFVCDYGKCQLSYSALKPRQLSAKDNEFAFLYNNFDACTSRDFNVFMLNIERCSRQHPTNVSGISWGQFERETMRLASYRYYPISAKKLPNLLSNAGFVYIGNGESDKVMCFFCLAVKENWLEDEDVDEVHRALSPHCSMATAHSSNNSVSAMFSMGAHVSEVHFHDNTDGHSHDTLVVADANQDSTTSAATVAPSSASGHACEEMNETNSASAGPHTRAGPVQRRQVTYEELGICVSRPKHPGYATASSRLQTFSPTSNWPVNHFLDINEVVRAGLYFAGYSDCCRCFYCGGGLRNWDVGDNPFIEHARWFSKCSFITQYLGQDFIHAVQDLNKEQESITLDQVRQLLNSRGINFPLLNEPWQTEAYLGKDAAVQALVEEGFRRADVESAAKELLRSGNVLTSDAILTCLTGVEDTGSQDEERVVVIRNENYTLRSNFTCKICMDKQIGVVFLPCGHFVTCSDCAWAFSNCPLCRRQISATVRATFGETPAN